MGMINLLDIEPHKVSRDMRGYSVFLYGDPKSGKTTTATRFPNHLLVAFEKGYNAIPGAMAQPINSWGEFKKLLKQLKQPEVQAKFETIIIDTADIAWDYAEKYICSNNNIDAIGDLGFGKGHTALAKEFDSCLRSIVQMNYGLVIISHATDRTLKDENDEEYNRILPTLAKKSQIIVSRMCDIIGYSRIVVNEEGKSSTKLFLRDTPRFMAGSRFRYTPDVIDFDYFSLVEAIGQAIDEEEKFHSSELFTDTRSDMYQDTTLSLDFDQLIEKFNSLIQSIPGSDLANPESAESINFKDVWVPLIQEAVESNLGRGKKVSDCSREQTEALDLVCSDLEDLINKRIKQ